MKQLPLLFLLLLLGCNEPKLRVQLSQTKLLANGYDNTVFRIDSSGKPRIELVGNPLFCQLREPYSIAGHWEAELHAGVMPGMVQVRVSSRRQHLLESIDLIPQIADSASDGTPDFLRLDTEADRNSFRFWFTYLAELQYFISPDKRPPEIKDCSSLVRYAYREALRNHDAAWTAQSNLPLIRAYPSISKYAFPHTLLGPAIFRTRSGRYSPQDLTSGAFAEFADAQTLQQFDTFFVSRDLTRAQSGDILFYRRQTSHGVSYHSMIFIGAGIVKPDAEIYVIYHTGPDGTSYREIRRLTLTQLLHFPNPQWQPIAANELFLGVYRWNILKALS